MKLIGNISNELFDEWNILNQNKWWQRHYGVSKSPYFSQFINKEKRMEVVICGNKINSLINDTINELENNFGTIKNAWLQVYYPNVWLGEFHKDGDLDRNIFIINSDNKMYNYEITNPNNHLTKVWNERWKNKTSVDDFNNEFLTYDTNKIHSGVIGSIYSFGKTIHSFYNNSDTARVSILFDFKTVEII